MEINSQNFLRGILIWIVLLVCHQRILYADNTITAQDASDAVEQVGNLIQDSWEEGKYYSEIVIDPDTDTVMKDDDTISFSEEFSVSRSEEKQILDSTDSVEDYFEDTVFDTEVQTDGTVIVTNDYQLKRIIVYTDVLKEDYGAKAVLYNEPYHQYILQFDTEEDTALAYEKILSEPSYKSCYLDKVLFSKDILEGTAQGGISYSWGVAAMGLDKLKKDAVTYQYSSDITVAILDTGVDTTNSFLKGRINKNSCDLIDEDTEIYDVDGHGTHVAGIIVDGTSSNIKLLCIKVFDDSGSSSFLVLQTGIQYALAQKVDVINMSLGWEDESASTCTELDSVINEAYQAGVPICTAAGNSAQNVKNSYPACNTKTLAVSAVDQEKNFASYSNYGSLIDFCAPGTNINGIVSSAVGEGTVKMTGTSMASPHIAAAIAMIRNVHPEYSVKQVYKVLQKYGIDLGEPGKDEEYGNGFPNLATYYYDTYMEKPDIAKAKVSGIVSKDYTGKALKQSVTVTYSGKKLKAGTDYTIAYSNNTKIGTASITFTGLGTYRGSLKKTFKITLSIPKLKKLTSTYNTQTLTWSQVVGASGYYIYLKNGNAWKRIKTISSGKTLTYTKKSLTCGTSYTYTVRAYYKSGNTIVKSSYNAKGLTAKAVTAAPTLKSVIKKAKGLQVNWKKVTGASGYYVYRKVKGSTQWTRIAKISSAGVTSYCDKTVKSSKTYVYTVRSYRTVKKVIIKGNYNKNGISL